MWAVAPMVMADPDMVFELYWPIFSDWSQHLDMRMLAYYIIMESHPPISRLLNVYWEMQAEPDNELYHFHYSYLQSMAHTTDPCHQVFRLNAAQILRFTRKPNYHGYSIFHQMDYIDKKYKFGGEFRGMYLAAGDARILHFDVNTQMFNVRSNYYSLYVRIDGLNEAFKHKFHLNLDSTTELFNYEETWNVIKSIPDMKDVTIEVCVGDNHQIMQTYYFEGSNLKDLHKVFEFFSGNQYSEAKNSIEIYYDTFTKIIFPTEMGLPAVMDILVPIFEHHHVDMKKEVANNLITMHFDNWYHYASHARCGLSFYNPVADVWQGVNRYHTYDVVFPLYADVTVNTQQHSVKISMKRHQDEHKDAMGIRSHVTSMVFIKDDLHHDILKKCCSKCDDFAIVTKGDEYRHNYTLFDVNGYNTGYKYFGAVYDSEVVPTQGDFFNLMTRVTSRDSKNYQTPYGHFLLSLDNWDTLLMLLPYPGTYGTLFKLVPSTENPVTQIDFTFRVNREYTPEKDQFLPGMKYNTRFTWALKNKEKAIKTWDMNAIFDTNPGHTLENTKVDITRIIPGQKDYKVCVEGTKKWTKDGVNGHMNVVMGQSADGKCDKDGATVEINMVGEQLEEQKTPFHVYEVCQPYNHYFEADYHSLYCAAEHTSVRKYTYDIKTHNVPTEFKKMSHSVLDYFRHVYKRYYDYEYDHEEEVADDHVKVKFEYTMGVPGDAMNVEVITPHDVHEFTGIPAQGLMYWGFYPDNTHYSELYMMMHDLGMMHTCIVHQDQVQHGLSERKHIEAHHLTNEWTLYAGDAEKDCQHGIFLKKIEGTNMIAFKTVHGAHSLEIYPEGEHGEHFKILVDGKQVSDHVDYHSEEWFSYTIREHLHSVILTTFHFHFHVEYKGDYVIIKMPKVHGAQFYGHCVHTA
ncbi:hypothetical protein ILUMI_26128 [Ignelater luminosus]|uniref:Uncharacterized protein n=1 Tax=Ignelater luminosus TaxID=2038154 RepID=A0A8K0C4N8_IGNLU|nr:hypothetical protein ILUMI_26128 [Ignelater luminosus]